MFFLSFCGDFRHLVLKTRGFRKEHKLKTTFQQNMWFICNVWFPTEKVSHSHTAETEDTIFAFQWIVPQTMLQPKSLDNLLHAQCTYPTEC